MINSRIIKYSEMELLTGLNRRSLWRKWAKEKSFPKPLMQNGRAVGWTEQQFNEWLASLSGGEHE